MNFSKLSLQESPTFSGDYSDQNFRYPFLHASDHFLTTKIHGNGTKSLENDILVPTDLFFGHKDTQRKTAIINCIEICELFDQGIQ